MRWLARILLAVGMLFCLSAVLPTDIGNFQLLRPFAPRPASSSGARRVFLALRVSARPDSASLLSVSSSAGRPAGPGS
jgi:hypothetical protein